jgi:hypothetical protein
MAPRCSASWSIMVQYTRQAGHSSHSLTCRGAPVCREPVAALQLRPGMLSAVRACSSRPVAFAQGSPGRRRAGYSLAYCKESRS